MKKPYTNYRGFSMVEVLITITIVGILAMVGLPTFRQMVQKSRVAEAQVALGNLATAEAAFYSEFGAFGNSLANLGIDYTPRGGSAIYASVAPDVSRRYAYGFTQGDCTGTSTPAPPQATTMGTIITNQLPEYYGNFPCTIPPISTNPTYCPQPSALGRTSLTICGTSGAPASITTPTDVYSSGGGTYNRYTAVASGVIAPGVDLDLPGTLGQVDVWTINESRELVHAQSGIR